MFRSLIEGSGIRNKFLKVRAGCLVIISEVRDTLCASLLDQKNMERLICSCETLTL